MLILGDISGIQDFVLHALGDPLGARFHDLRMHDETSPLHTRNRSILAHGFQPITRKQYNAMEQVLRGLFGQDLEPQAWALPEPL